MSGPVRTCIGCRSRRPQSELVRLVADESGELTVGRSLPGRGSWICEDRYLDCGRVALERKAFGRALRTKLAGGATLPRRP